MCQVIRLGLEKFPGAVNGYSKVPGQSFGFEKRCSDAVNCQVKCLRVWHVIESKTNQAQMIDL